MVIKYRPSHHNGEPITLALPAGAEVEIHLYPGDMPTIDPHKLDRSQDGVRTFDVIINPNGDLFLDWVNLTKVANAYDQETTPEIPRPGV